MLKKSKFFLFTFMTMSVLGLTLLSIGPTYAVCPADIVSYWKLNEAAGPTYTDFIGDNNGTGNSNPVQDADGAVNEAQQFDGADDGAGIDVPASRTFNWHGDENFTMEYWIKIAAAPVGTNDVALGRFEAGGVFWFTGIDTNGFATLTLQDTDGVSSTLTGTTNLADSGWHHIVVVRDDTVGVNGTNFLYVDGVEEDSEDIDYTGGFLSNSAELNIGWFDFTGTGQFRFLGSIDEVALYDRALPDTEIQAHFTNGGLDIDYCEGSAAPAAPNAAPFPDNTISLWKLDETDGPTYADSFNGNNGTGNSNPAQDADGAVNEAQQFDGADDGAGIDVPSDRSFDWLGNDNFTMEYWIKIAAAPVGTNDVALGRFETGGVFWFTGIDTNGFATLTLQDTDGVSSTLTGTTNLADSGWHHIVVVRDDTVGVNGTNFLYVDGVEEDSEDIDYTGGFLSNSAELNIGWFDFTGTGQFRFLGSIDEVALYDRALPDTEIQAHFTAGGNGDGVESLRPVPVANAGTDQANVKETTGVTLDGTGSTIGYAGTAISTYLWEEVTTSGVTITNASAATAGFTAPDVAAAGETLTFRLTVTADDGQSNSDTVDISVVDRIAPVADAGGNKNAAEGSQVTLDGSGSDDADGTIASYAWVQTDGTTVTLTNDDTATATFTAPDVDLAGESLTFELTVTDNDGLTDTDNATVSVTDLTIPVADAGQDQNVREGDIVTLDGSNSSDADGTIASYAWVQTAGTPTVTLTNDTTATATFTAPDVDVAGAALTFQLTVTDNDGQSSEDEIVVNVSDNTLPIADAGNDQNVTEGDTVTLTGSGTDSDGTIASYLWKEVTTSGVTLSGADTATASFIAPEVGAAGQTLTFRLTVTDNDGLTGTDTVNVTVSDQGSPLADAGDDQTVKEGSVVTLDGSESSDANGTIDSYLWEQTSGTAVTLSGTDTAMVDFTAPEVDVAGETLTFRLTVTDNDGLTSIDPVSIAVNDETVHPADAGPDQTAPQGSVVTLDGTQSSVVGGRTIVSYLWEQTGGTEVELTDVAATATAITMATANTAKATFTAPTINTAEETLTFRLTVTDDNGDEFSDTSDVTVTGSSGSGSGGGSGCFISTMFK